MKEVASLLVPILMITAWLGIAIATTVKLANLGGTLTAAESAELARQTLLHAPRVASASPSASAE